MSAKSDTRTLADAEAEIQKLRSDLESTRSQLLIHQEKSKEVSRLKSLFLGKVSHELRTPMNGVLGMLQLALDEELPSIAREYCTLAMNSGETLLRLVESLLDLSSLEAGTLTKKPQKIQARQFVEDFEKLVFCSIDKTRPDVNFLCSISDNVPESFCIDGDKLRQILLNLVGNAFKFAHRSGAVVLHVDFLSAPENSGEHNQLWLGVSDTGVGIPEHKIADIFDAFVQVDNSFTRNFGGVGLGLAIASELVSVLGGAIRVESKVGIGSRFEVKLPVEDPHTIAKPITNVVEPSIITPNLRVLIAEDNCINQQLIVAMLESLGCQTQTADNGEEALGESMQQEFDIILLDIQMPLMDGVTACNQIRSNNENKNNKTPIVAVTANAMSEDREKYLDLGMDGYVSKPLKRQDIINVIHELVPNAKPTP